MLQYFLPLLLASVVSAQDQSFVVVANNPVTLHCYDRNLERNMYWLVNGEKVAEGETVYNENYAVGFNGNSYYLTFAANNSGNYECKQQNNNGVSITKTWYQIAVAERVNAVANNTVTLSCTVNSDMVWRYNNFHMDEVQLNDRVWINNTDEYQYDLIISNALPADSMTYLCFKTRKWTTNLERIKVAYAVFVSNPPTPTTTTTTTPTPTTTTTTTTLAPEKAAINNDVTATTTVGSEPPRLIIALVCGGVSLVVIGVGVAVVCCRRRRRPLPAARNVELQEFIETV